MLRRAFLVISSLTAVACSTPPEKDPVYEGSPTAQVSEEQIAEWNQAYAWGNHASAGYLQAETDPAFAMAPAAGIAVADLANWNAAYAWGDHATAGYLKTEAEPAFAASTAAGITSNDVSRWQTTYAWGNHATAGYLKTESDPKIGTLVTGALPRWTGTQLQNGSMTDTGSRVGIGTGTGTPNAVLDVYAASGNAVLDQSQTQLTYAISAPVISQSFTAGATGDLSAIDVHLVGSSSTFTVTLKTASGAFLASATCTAFAADSWVTCRLPSPVSVTQGTVYSMNFTSASALNLSGADNLYPGGSLSFGSAYDLSFRTYVGQLKTASAFEVGANAVNIKTLMHLTPLGAAPTPASAGDVYFDGALKKLRYYDGAAWISL